MKRVLDACCGSSPYYDSSTKGAKEYGGIDYE